VTLEGQPCGRKKDFIVAGADWDGGGGDNVEEPLLVKEIERCVPVLMFFSIRDEAMEDGKMLLLEA
jgi:hypothetical protein